MLPGEFSDSVEQLHGPVCHSVDGQAVRQPRGKMHLAGYVTELSCLRYCLVKCDPCRADVAVKCGDESKLTLRTILPLPVARRLRHGEDGRPIVERSGSIQIQIDGAEKR